MPKIISQISILFILIMFTASSNASSNTFEAIGTFVGSWTTNDFSVGDRVRFVFSYDDSIADSQTNDWTNSRFPDAITYFSMELFPNSSGSYAPAHATMGDIFLQSWGSRESFRMILGANDGNFPDLDGGMPSCGISMSFSSPNNIYTNNNLSLGEQLNTSIDQINYGALSPGFTVFGSTPMCMVIAHGNIDSIKRIHDLFTPRITEIKKISTTDYQLHWVGATNNLTIQMFDVLLPSNWTTITGVLTGNSYTVTAPVSRHYFRLKRE